MEDLNKAIEGVLNDPEMMGKIMGMAQALGGPSASGEENPQNPEPPDLSKLPDLGNLLGSAAIDKDQENLLKALSAYISGSHIGKLRRAMQAARLAELATSMAGPSLFSQGESHV